jgi:hypothetical protein
MRIWTDGSIGSVDAYKSGTVISDDKNWGVLVDYGKENPTDKINPTSPGSISEQKHSDA